MARNNRPFHSPNSMTLTMCGWASCGHHLGFALEPLHDLLDADELGMQQLQRDRLARGELLGAIDTAHAPLADHLDEAVAVAERVADQRRFFRYFVHRGSPCGIGSFLSVLSSLSRGGARPLARRAPM